MTPEQPAGLRAAVFRRTARDPVWVGYWLRRHQDRERLSEAELAEHLGLTMEQYAWLCLCRVPRADRLRDDLEAICRRTGVRELDLLRLLRQEQNLAMLDGGGPASAQGWLMAAADRPPQEPPDEDGDD
jgi:hypothetical protein